ncbi:MAG: conjugal transfer protein TraG N-terminal domain-containing protein [Pseudomonadota bacterium]
MFEIYAYANNASLTGIFNAIAAIMGGGDYMDLIRVIGLLGLLIAIFAGLFSPGRAQFHGWTWFMGFMLVYMLAFVPKATVVVVDKLGSSPPVAIGNVPLGVAFFGHVTSKIGDVLTTFFETAFQVIPDPVAKLPSELTYQRNGVLFGNRLIQQSRKLNVNDPQLRTDLISFINNCTLYDLSDGAAAGGIDPKVFAESLDIWPLMSNASPGRFSTYGNPATVDTCVNVYNVLNGLLPAAIAESRAKLAFMMNPALSTADAGAAIDSQVQSAYRKLLGIAAMGTTELLRQNILVNLVQDTSLVKGQQISDPASVMLATSRAQATASVNSSYMAMGAIAAEALPMFRNVIEGVIYAIFPFVLLLMLMSQGRGLGMIIKSFIFGLIWIQLWPPLYAILNYVATLASSQNLTAAATLPTGLQVLSLDTAASIYNGAISDQAVAGYLVISIPIIATAIIKGGEVAFQAVTGVAGIQSAAQAEGAAAGRGQVSQGTATVDKYSLDAQYGAPSMETRVDGSGNARISMSGTGVEAVKMLQNDAYFGAQLASARVNSLEQAASKAGERGRMESTTAATEAVSALAETVSKSKDRFSAQELGSGITSTDASGLQETHQRIKGVADTLKRNYGLQEGDESLVAIAAQAGLGIDIAKRASKGVSRGMSMSKTEPGAAANGASGTHSMNGNQGLAISGGGGLNIGASGRATQNYTTRLQRAYDEARQNVSQEQVQRSRDYLSRLSSDQNFRAAVLSRQGDAEQVNASFNSARRHQEEARASFTERDTFAEQVRVARSESANTSYDWGKDPANTSDVLAIGSRLKGTQDPIARQGIIDSYFAEKVAMSRPMRYMSGDSVRWSSGEVERLYEEDKQSSNLNPNLTGDHGRNVRAMGGASTVPVSDAGLRERAANDHAEAKTELGETRRHLAKDQVKAQQRFDKESGLEGQDRDGQFGAKQSTGTRAFDNAMEDGKRSAQNFVDGVEDLTFGTVDRILNGKK